MDELYEDIERLFPNWKSVSERALLYAMIDMGHVTDLSCSWEHCVLPGAPLAPRGGGVKKDSLTFDHTVARIDGGTDHWSNLRLMHYTCNMRKGHAMGDATRRRMSDATKRRWEDPEYSEKVRDRITQRLNDEDVREKRSAAMKAHWADPAKRAAHAAQLPRGTAWHEKRSLK